MQQSEVVFEQIIRNIAIADANIVNACVERCIAETGCSMENMALDREYGATINEKFRHNITVVMYRHSVSQKFQAFAFIKVGLMMTKEGIGSYRTEEELRLEQGATQ